MPRPSDETLDFAGQLLAEGEKVETPAALTAWSRLLENAPAPAPARSAAFRAWLIAHSRGWPVPSPAKAQLHGLDLESWEIGVESRPPLDLRGASLAGACLDHAVLTRVLLTAADATGASARCAEMHDVTLDDSVWEGADLSGGEWRGCAARGLKAATAIWHDCDVVRCDLAGASLPPRWLEEAAAGLPTGREAFSLVLRQGHLGAVTSVAWSPDGARLISSDRDATIREWDATTGTLLRYWVTADGEAAFVDAREPRILRATPGGWRLLGWQGWDQTANRRRLLPAETFGPI